MKTSYKAPGFTLPDTDGRVHTLDEYVGKWVVLYFYPKDDTPGCTLEACSLRDARDVLAQMGAEIIGISKDDASSHEKFKEKYSLNFTLLTDIECVVVKVYGRVTPVGHGEQVMSALKSLQENA